MDFESKGFDSILEDDLDIQILEVKLQNNAKLDSPMDCEPMTDVKKPPEKNNPVEEHLLKQLNCAVEQIDIAKNNISTIEDVTSSIIKHLTAQCAYKEDPDTDSEDEMYSSTGEPIKKKKKNNQHAKKQVMMPLNVWQRVVGDKWIIGVILKSNTTCVLKNPTIYICTKDKSRDSWHGLTAFWTLVDDTYWYPAEEVGPKEHIVATTVLGLPNFLNEPSIEAHGTIFSEFDDKLFQTRLPVIRLDVQDTVAGKCAIDLDNPEDAPFSILALKAISVDRVVLLPVQSNSNTGKRLIDFLDEYNFKEVCKVCIVRDAGSLQYCLIEVLPAEDTDVRLLISARSEAQLSVVVQLMIETFPELLDVENQQALDEAAEALRKEMQLYLSCNDTVQIQRARVTTDLLIP